MIEEIQKTLIIVCDKETEKYANYLRQLISSNDDTEEKIVGIKDGSVSVSVWPEKEYADNKINIDSSEHILFIGNNKIAKDERSTMKEKYSDYGCKYSWLGKRGCLSVTRSIKTKKKYKNFIEECKNFEYTVDNPAGLGSKIFGAGVASGSSALMVLTIISPVIAAATVATTAAIGGAVSLFERSKIIDQQYRFLIVKFYLDDLAKFLEE